MLAFYSFFTPKWCLSVLELRMSSDMGEEPLGFLAGSVAHPLAALPCLSVPCLISGCCLTAHPGDHPYDLVSLAWPRPESPPYMSWSHLKPQAAPDQTCSYLEVFGGILGPIHTPGDWKKLRKHYCLPVPVSFTCCSWVLLGWGVVHYPVTLWHWEKDGHRSSYGFGPLFFLSHIIK